LDNRRANRGLALDGSSLNPRAARRTASTPGPSNPGEGGARVHITRLGQVQRMKRTAVCDGNEGSVLVCALHTALLVPSPTGHTACPPLSSNPLVRGASGARPSAVDCNFTLIQNAIRARSRGSNLTTGAIVSINTAADAIVATSLILTYNGRAGIWGSGTIGSCPASGTRACTSRAVSMKAANDTCTRGTSGTYSTTVNARLVLVLNPITAGGRGHTAHHRSLPRSCRGASPCNGAHLRGSAGLRGSRSAWRSGRPALVRGTVGGAPGI